MDVDTYNLSVEEMFANHYCVDRRRILKGQKGKASRLAVRVAYDGTSIDFPKLRKVVSQTVCWSPVSVTHT